MFERFRDQLIVTPKPIPPVKNPREFIQRAAAGHEAPALLEGSRGRTRTRRVDDAYYQSFFARNRTVLELRLNGSIAAVAAMIAGAWDAAGPPAFRSTNPHHLSDGRKHLAFTTTAT